VLPLDAGMSGVCSQENNAHCAIWHTAWMNVCLLSRHFYQSNSSVTV